MKLLIVEDEQTIRDGIVNRPNWAELGVAEVRAASGAREALALLESYTPDLVISDIQMPGMNGLALCRRIREKLPGTQIIILTGYDEKEYLKEAIDIGVVSFIEKPLSLTVLRRAVDKARSFLPESVSAGDKEEESGSGSAPQERVSDAGAAVRKVIRYIEDHYWEESLSLKVLSDQVYLTPQYLSSLFKSETGQTIGQYMSDYRIGQAKRMLADPAYKLYQISELAGYKDASYFARLFKKKTGLTPSEYRNQYESPE